MPRTKKKAWKTDEVKAALENATGRKVVALRRGGDYDTSQLKIDIGEAGDPDYDAITVIGFDDEHSVDDPDYLEDVKFVEVRNWNADCDGGLQTTNVEVATVYAQARGVVEKFGWWAAFTHDSYF